MKNSRHKKTPSVRAQGVSGNEINFEEEIVMANNSTAVSRVIPFNFCGRELRTLLIDEQPWFVAADVCDALGIKNNRMAVAKLDEDEKGVSSIDTLGGEQEMLIVNESGLNAIILRCREAMTPGTPSHSYRKWVTSEVLPAIRKSGGYIHEAAMRPALTKEHWAAINQAVAATTCGWAFSDDSKNWIYNRMRVVFQVARVQDVPDDQFELVMLMLQDMKESKYSFLAFLMEARTWFEKEVLGGGQPWTPTIKSKLTRQLQRQVILPPRVDWLALAQQVEGRVSV